ncbi:MAG: hypothetical protein H7841_07685 [Magnetospirillum sp. WYHS-4]
MTAAARLLPGALATLLFLGAALWNGYVLLYYDSVDYIYLPFDWEDLPAYRTAAYAVVTTLGKLAGSLWAVILFQCLATAYVLHEALEAFVPGRTEWLVPQVALLLTLCTGLPWFTGQLMPDAFTGPVVMGFMVLAFGREDLPAWRRLLLVALVTAGTAVHTSHVGLVVGLILSLGLLRLALRRRWPEFRPRLGVPALTVVLALGFIVATHWVTQGRPFLAQPTHMLWLARLVQDGIAKRFLDDVCPTRAEEFKLCPYKDDLPPLANDFLWHGLSVIHKLGGWEGLQGEAQVIIRESIRRYPLLHARALAVLTAEQLVMFRTGDGIISMRWMVGDVMRQYYPNEAKAVSAARQEKGISFREMNWFHIPFLAAAQLALFPLLVWSWRRRDRVSFALAATLLLALLGNAFICGALSNPNHRYQGRIVWVAVVVVAIGLSRFRDAAARAEPDRH